MSLCLLDIIFLCKSHINNCGSELPIITDSSNQSFPQSPNFEIISKVAPTNSRVLITGEKGTGKELVARKIHKNSKRKNKPFVIINGALLDNDKYDLELFGEEKSDGSISYGALEKANNGTLLVDQVSEIPLAIQSKILRVLTDQKFKRVNGNNLSLIHI
mgnify:CR=1 FL=1